jgi:hypothetical protein
MDRDQFDMLLEVLLSGVTPHSQLGSNNPPRQLSARTPVAGGPWQLPLGSRDAFDYGSNFPELGHTSDYGAGLPQFGSWSPPQAFEQSMSSIAAEPVSFRAWPRPRAAPGWAPPGIFDPWAEQFQKGMQGLLEFRSQRRGGGGGGGGERRRSPECDEEWREAYMKCHDEVYGPDPPRGWNGRPITLEQCARGRVTADCGGNPVEHGPWPRKPKPWLRKR